MHGIITTLYNQSSVDELLACKKNLFEFNKSYFEFTSFGYV